jgi:single-strand DNA-binding protein
MQFDLTIEGNVAEAPELRFTPSGKALCKFRLGHNTRRRTAAGEWVDGPTIWFTVAVWEALAERVAESIRKGDTVTVQSRSDLSVFAYINQTSGKAAGELQISAANVALSLRFNTAGSHRKPKPAVEVDDPWAAENAGRESEPAF